METDDHAARLPVAQAAMSAQDRAFYIRDADWANDGDALQKV